MCEKEVYEYVIISVLFAELLAEAVRRNNRFRNATDVDIRLRAAAYFTNSRDRKHGRTVAVVNDDENNSSEIED